MAFLPEMGAIISVSEEYAGEAETLALKMRASGLRVKADVRSETVGKRIRSAVSRRVPYIVVYGEAERQSGELKVRVQGRTEEMIMSAEELTAYMVRKVKSRELGY